MRKHTCRKRQESSLNAYTAYFQLSYLLYADNPLAYIHTTTSHTISETAHTVCQKGLSATLPKASMHRLWLLTTWSGICRFHVANNHKQCIEKLAGSSAVSHPPFSLLFFIILFLFTVIYSCCSHVGFLSALPLRIFTAKVQVVRHTSNRASMDASEKSSSVCAI